MKMNNPSAARVLFLAARRYQLVNRNKLLTEKKGPGLGHPLAAFSYHWPVFGHNVTLFLVGKKLATPC